MWFVLLKHFPFCFSRRNSIHSYGSSRKNLPRTSLAPSMSLIPKFGISSLKTPRKLLTDPNVSTLSWTLRIPTPSRLWPTAKCCHRESIYPTFCHEISTGGWNVIWSTWSWWCLYGWRRINVVVGYMRTTYLMPSQGTGSGNALYGWCWWWTHWQKMILKLEESLS